MGSRVMSRVRMPNRRAAMACPSSCRTTVAKIASTNITAPNDAAMPPPAATLLSRMNAINKRNVACR